MPGGFAELLKLSRTQTAESELAVQTQIANRQLEIEKKRREQEARERKEREIEARLRAKRFEEQRKEEERKLKREEEKRALERDLLRREEEMRDALKYGPRKAAARSSRANADGRADSNGESRREHRSPPDVLTREEKRQRKVTAEMRRSSLSTTTTSRRKSKNSTALLPNGRAVRRLPGGAVDFAIPSRLADPDAAPPAAPTAAEGMTTRERLAAIPSTLTKLNTVKRDLRTIDEILVERSKARQAKTLAGDDAKEFSDWFGKDKRKEPQAKSSGAPSRAVSTPPSSNDGSPAPSAPRVAQSPVKSKNSKSSSSSFLKPINPRPKTVARPAIASQSVTTTKKRPHSLSASPSPSPPPKRPAPSRGMDLSSEIWSLFGKDKRAYVARDVLSDDEDMEADAESVLKEELRSSRLAYKEDSIALAEERRHEEEKRRRKKERERRERERHT